MVKALIGMGANLGKPAENLEAAKSELADLQSTKLLATSDWITTAPVGGPENQGEFLNGAALLETSLSPDSLVAELQRIEKTLGRERIVRWGPRLIDLDIVLYGDQVVDSPQLTVPHPWMALRRFVLEPTAQIASEMVHPIFGWSVGRLYENLGGKGRIAIASIPSIDSRSVATWLVEQTGGVALFAPDSGTLPPLESGTAPTLAQLLNLVNRWSEKLNEPVDRIPEQDNEPVVISDRCGEELLAAGAIHLDKTDFQSLCDAWKSSFAQHVDSRKLLVVLTDSSLAQDNASFASQLLQRVKCTGHGPWIELDASDPDRMRHDLLAVVTGMR